MHQTYIDVVGSELLAETIQISAGGGSITRPGLCENRNFVAWHMFQGLGYVGMAAVGIRALKESQTGVIAVEKHVGEALNAQRSLVGVVPTADRSRSHGQPACFDAS